MLKKETNWGERRGQLSLTGGKRQEVGGSFGRIM